MVAATNFFSYTRVVPLISMEPGVSGTVSLSLLSTGRQKTHTPQSFQTFAEMHKKYCSSVLAQRLFRLFSTKTTSHIYRGMCC